MISYSQTQYTHMRGFWEILITKLMPGFVSSAGTGRGAKQLVFPGVDFSH